jgi:hypothetical protein
MIIPLHQCCSRELLFNHGWSINFHPERVRLISNSLLESRHPRFAAGREEKTRFIRMPLTFRGTDNYYQYNYYHNDGGDAQSPKFSQVESSGG